MGATLDRDVTIVVRYASGSDVLSATLRLRRGRDTGWLLDRADRLKRRVDALLAYLREVQADAAALDCKIGRWILDPRERVAARARRRKLRALERSLAARCWLQSELVRRIAVVVETALVESGEVWR